MSDQLDPLWWMNTDILSLPDHFGTLPDLFDQAFLGYNGGGGGAGGAASGASPGDPGEVVTTGGGGGGGDNEGRQGEEELHMMTGLEAIATAAAAAEAAVAVQGPLGSGTAVRDEGQVSFDHHHHNMHAARGEKAAGASHGMSSTPITMIGADGLFDLRSFLENGSGLGTSTTATTTAAAAAAATTTTAARQQ